MPNHIHVVWKMIEKNGKEMPHASFNKFTAHKIVEDLKIFYPNVLTISLCEDTKRGVEYHINYGTLCYKIY